MVEPRDQVRFLVNIQRIFKDGQFTATYKFALLMALADICVERSAETAPRISTLDIAEKFIRYYWKHSIPYAGSGEHGPVVLRQNTGNQAAVITRRWP